MKLKLALLLLHFYPRTWRMRYEEEVRVMLEDCAPNWRDVAGLARGAFAEWRESFGDPVAHPWLASLVPGGMSWLAASTAIHIGGVAGGEGLRAVLGSGPEIGARVASLTVFALCIRCMSAGITWRRSDGPFRHLSAAETRVWWIALVAVAVLGHWSNGEALTVWQFWMIGAAILLGVSPSAWVRAIARAEWIHARDEHQDKVRGYMIVSRQVAKGLATKQELDDLGQDVARLNVAVKHAADGYRAATRSLRAPQGPLGLS